MNCTYAISGKCESNLFLKASTDRGSAGWEERAGGDDDTWSGKVGRGGEPVDQGSWVQERESVIKKVQKMKNLSHNIYKKNPKNVGHRIGKPKLFVRN